MTKLSLAAAAFLASVAAIPADAAMFIFAGVKFGDGATVSGSFVTDPAFTMISDFSVSTAPGAGTVFGIFPSSTSGQTYTPGSGSVAPLSSTGVLFSKPGIFPVFGIPIFGSNLLLQFSAPLSSGGAAVAGGSESARLFFRRSVAAGGTVSPVATPPVSAAVPEPATWGMMLLGFGAMGFAMRRRAKVRTNVSLA